MAIAATSEAADILARALLRATSRSAAKRPVTTPRDTAYYNELTEAQQIQLDHLLDLLDPEYGLTDPDQRRTISLIAAQVAGIALPYRDEIARCIDDCPVIRPASGMHETADGYRCTAHQHSWAAANDDAYTGRL